MTSNKLIFTFYWLGTFLLSRLAFHTATAISMSNDLLSILSIMTTKTTIIIKILKLIHVASFIKTHQSAM